MGLSATPILAKGVGPVLTAVEPPLRAKMGLAETTPIWPLPFGLGWFGHPHGPKPFLFLFFYLLFFFHFGPWGWPKRGGLKKIV
jgi:hypothetical protein